MWYRQQVPITVPYTTRPSVLSGGDTVDHGGDQTCATAEGTKNSCIRIGRHGNLYMTTFNRKTVSAEAGLEVFNELEFVKWVVIGGSDVTRTSEVFTVVKNGRILCYRGLVDRRELGEGHLDIESIVGNIEEYYITN